MESNMNNNELISIEINYFTEIFIFIEEILHMNSPTENQINQIINLIKNKDEKIKKETEFYLKKALSESVYKESSLIFRYILGKIYNYDYSNIHDYNIVNSVFDNMERSNLNFFENDNITEFNLENILKNNDERTLKSIGNFFDNYN